MGLKGIDFNPNFNNYNLCALDKLMSPSEPWFVGAAP